MENTIESYAALWLRLEKIYWKLWREGNRYCIRNIVRELYPTDADIPCYVDGSKRERYLCVWEICAWTEYGGFEQIGEPLMCLRRNRPLIQIIAMIEMRTGVHGTTRSLVDKGYRLAKHKWNAGLD